MAMTLRNSAAAEAALEYLAEREGTSKQEAVNRALVERADRLAHEDRVLSASRELSERYRGALDRLGSV